MSSSSSHSSWYWPFRIALLPALLILAAPGHGYETENVFLVIIDGLRYSEGLGDPSHTFVPEMAALAAQGTIVEPFTNDGITNTARAVPAIWCGAWTDVQAFPDPACAGQSNNYSVLPTVFEYYRKQLARSVEDCIYVLKEVDCPWKASFDVDYGPDYWPMYHSQGTPDIEVWQETVTVLDTYAPSLMLLYLASVDYWGHSGNWNDYVEAIVVADSIVGMLWDYAQAHPTYSGTTTMIVTNDHGRHDYDFRGHGDGCAGCRTIQMLAVGPDVLPGALSTTPRTLRDVTPTIGELLGFETEGATGTVMTEILENGTGTAESPAQARELHIDVVPNPFRTSVGISFCTPATGRCVVNIYDVAGHRVRTLLSDHLPAGSYLASWDATDCRGHSVGSGVYFVRLEAEGKAVTRKLIRLRP